MQEKGDTKHCYKKPPNIECYLVSMSKSLIDCWNKLNLNSPWRTARRFPFRLHAWWEQTLAVTFDRADKWPFKLGRKESEKFKKLSCLALWRAAGLAGSILDGNVICCYKGQGSPPPVLTLGVFLGLDSALQFFFFCLNVREQADIFSLFSSNVGLHQLACWPCSRVFSTKEARCADLQWEKIHNANFFSGEEDKRLWSIEAREVSNTTNTSKTVPKKCNLKEKEWLWVERLTFAPNIRLTSLLFDLTRRGEENSFSPWRKALVRYKKVHSNDNVVSRGCWRGSRSQNEQWLATPTSITLNKNKDQEEANLLDKHWFQRRVGEDAEKKKKKKRN